MEGSFFSSGTTTSAPRPSRCTPMRFRLDPVTGVYWPEFWLLYVTPALLAQTESEASTASASVQPPPPQFILVPERWHDGYVKLLGGELTFKVALSTDVLKSEPYQVTGATEREALLEAVSESPFAVKESAGLVREFLKLVITLTEVVDGSGGSGDSKGESGTGKAKVRHFIPQLVSVPFQPLVVFSFLAVKAVPPPKRVTLIRRTTAKKTTTTTTKTTMATGDQVMGHFNLITDSSNKLTFVRLLQQERPEDPGVLSENLIPVKFSYM